MGLTAVGDERPPLLAGAYAASPSKNGWDAALESRFVQGLRDLDGLDGLEIPWTGALHPYDVDWFLASLDPTWSFVVTNLPDSTSAANVAAGIGLGAVDADARRVAVERVLVLFDAVKRLHDALGRRGVLAVELHSAPGTSGVGGVSSADALRVSLETLASADTDGAEIVLEHCDATVAGHPPAKGFLDLEAEITASAGLPVGLSLNWGRSAIELHSADIRPHVLHASATDRLRGIVFSGAGPKASAFGDGWSDVHLPFCLPGSRLPASCMPEPTTSTEPTSLLTPERATEVLDAVDTLQWLGVKVGVRPLDASPENRVRAIATSLGLVRAAIAGQYRHSGD